MSDCKGTTSPASDGGASAPSPIQGCPHSGSEVLVIDELGLPLANTPVTVQPSGGGSFSGTTGGDGRICFSLPPGSSVQISIGNIHEAGPGESTSTASGQHFRAGGDGP